MNILILRVPGSGKGTQAKILAEELDFKQFSTGEMLRVEAECKTELGQRTKNIIDSGKLVSDEIMIDIISRFIDQSKFNSGLIFDGYPRTVPQAKALGNLLTNIGKKVDHVIELIVDDEAIVERIAGRYLCNKCDYGYHEKFCKPKVSGICDKCGSKKFIKRKDDNAKTVRSRVKHYHHHTAPIIAFYSDAGILHRINGMLTMDVVTKKFKEILQ